MALMEKDVAMAADLGEAAGVGPLSMAPAILRNYRMGMERFGRNGDIHNMLRFYEEAAGVAVAKKPA
jgi:hypothetical protein